jgi:hypothetical protein
MILAVLVLLASAGQDDEAQGAADHLYREACSLNGVAENAAAFAEDRVLKDRGSWEAAERAYRFLVDGGEAEARVRLARCLSFLARDEAEWEQARAQYAALIKSKKALLPNGTLDSAVIQGDPALLQVYFELGETHFEIAKRGAKAAHFADAATVYSNVLRLALPDTALWWQGKCRVLDVCYQSGMQAEGRSLHLHPLGEQARTSEKQAYDGGRFGMKPKLEALMEKIRKAQSSR